MKKADIEKLLNQIDWNLVEFVVSMKRHLNQPCPSVDTSMRKLGKRLLTDLVKSGTPITAIECGLLRASRYTEDGSTSYHLSFIPFAAHEWL